MEKSLSDSMESRMESGLFSGVIQVYKKIGQTPKDVINDIKKIYPDRKMGFSGRLDPMAKGLMYVLVGDAVKNTEKFHKHNKTYRFQVIISCKTDTDDILGLLKEHTNENYDFINIINSFKEMEKTYQQEYHHYSSMTINNKPLWYYSKNNLLDTITIPTKEVTIFNLRLLYKKTIRGDDLKNDILKRLDKLVKHNHMSFRTEEIIEQWKNEKMNNIYEILVMEADVSYGTYIRQLVKDVSNYIKIPLCVLEIERIKISNNDTNELS